MVLVNARSEQAIATNVTLASTRAERRQGLLGRTSLDVSEALVLSPCWSIHTMFMRFPIDVLFIDGAGKAIRIVTALAPWRIAIEPRAKATIELAAGSLMIRDVRLGDEIRIVAPVSS